MKTRLLTLGITAILSSHIAFAAAVASLVAW